MINILPIEEKKKIITEYRLRLSIVSVFAVAALMFSSLVLLIPSYLLAVLKYNNATQELSTLKGKANTEEKEKNTDAQIVDINNKINLLLRGDEKKQITPSQVIADILNVKGAAIKIYGFTHDISADQDRVVIFGTADNRDSLAEFVAVLKKKPEFVSVELPISSYVKSSNIDFSIVAVRGNKTQTKK